MQYSLKTVLVHSAFLHADKELNQRSRSLKKLTKEDCSVFFGLEAVNVVTQAILEARDCCSLEEGNLSMTFTKILPSEVDALNYKFNAWIFRAWQKDTDKLVLRETFRKRNDYFSSFPPLPRFSTAFYLALVKELDWSKIFVEVSF